MQTWSYPSKSSDKTYTTVLADDGKLLCNCRGWTIKKEGKPRRCDHVNDVILTHGYAVEAKGDYLYMTGANGAVKRTLIMDISGEAPTTPTVVPPAPILDGACTIPEPQLAAAMVKKIKGIAFDAAYGTCGWALEEKFDGWRIGIDKRDGAIIAWQRPKAGEQPKRCELLTPAILDGLQHLSDGIYDGELVVPGGKSWDVPTKGAQLMLVLFDVLAIGGENVMPLPYSERRYRLLCELAKLPEGQMAITTESVAPSWAAVEAIWARGGEGAILKRLDSPYRPGSRTDAWTKVKQLEHILMRIVGFEAGKSGPYSAATVLDPISGKTTTVKTLDNATRRAIAAAPGAWIDRILVCNYQIKTPEGKWRHIMWDHLASPGEQVA
jgi:hypothetical protein